MPGRSELEPAELRSILPDLILIDVGTAPDGQGHTFTYRLAGTEIDRRLGVNLTGRRLEEVPLGDAAAAIRKQYEAVVAEARPIFCKHKVVIGGERYVEYERLVVPLSGDQPGQITALAAAVDFHCAFTIANGRPPDCTTPPFCDRIDHCLAQTPGNT